MTESSEAGSTPMPPTLLLLHGLGATAGVWADVVAELEWPGRVVAPDLRGHGRAPWTKDYSLEALAGAVACEFTAGEPTIIIGHSLGGAVGVELASGRYDLDVIATIGLGIKTTWTDDDVVGMAKVAERGVRWFETRDDAVARFLRMAGLDGLVEADHPAVANAVVDGPTPDGATGSGKASWRLAQDPATFAQQSVDLAELLAAATGPVVLGAGVNDAMATEAELAAFTDRPQIAPECGHNLQVEKPRWVGDLLSGVLADLGLAGPRSEPMR